MKADINDQSKFSGVRAFLWANAALLVAWGLSALVMYRLQSYVCAQDPRMYIRLARALAENPIASPEWWGAFYTISPFYPLVLAFSIKCFGVYAPYWVNFVFFLGLLTVLALLARAIFRNPWAEAILLFSTIYVLLSSDPFNIQYLLFPFRETASFFFIFLGFLLTHRAATEARRPPPPGLAPGGRSAPSARWWGLSLAAGMAFVLAVASREPSIVALAGPLVWIGTRWDLPWPRRLGHGALLLLPLAAAIGAWFVIGSLTGSQVTGQFLGWSAAVSRGSAEAAFRSWLHNVGRMIEYLRNEYGWAGLLLVLVGTWKLRRRWDALLFFHLTAALFLAFYGLYLYLVRYALSTTLFLCPVFGFGVFALAEFVSRVFSRLFKRDLARLLMPAACAILLVADVGYALLLQETGFSRQNVREFSRSVNALAGSNVVAFTERRARDIFTALDSYTDLRPRGLPEKAGDYRAEGRTVIFFQPLNEACFNLSRIRDDGVRIAEALSSRGDLVSMRSRDGRPLVLDLGEGFYAVQELKPWTHRSVSEAIALVPGADQIAWLDFRQCEPECRKTIRVRDPSGAVVMETAIERGQGLQALLIPGRGLSSGQARLEIEADCPLPQKVFRISTPVRHATHFSMENDRYLSTTLWFEPPFALGTLYTLFGAAFTGEGILRLPPPPGGNAVGWEVGLDWIPISGSGQEISITYQSGGRILAERPLLVKRASTVHRFVAPCPAGGAEETIRITSTPPDPGALIAIAAVELRPVFSLEAKP